jgi:hypothetical protein
VREQAFLANFLYSKKIKSCKKKSTQMERHTLFLTSNSAFTDHTDLTQATFRTSITPSIKIPPDKQKDAYISVNQLSVWNFFLNVSAALNNSTIYYSDDVGLPEKYSITLPDGSYDVPQLSNDINALMLANGHNVGFSCVGNDALQKLVVTISQTGWMLYLKANESPYLLMGYASNDKIPITGVLTTSSYTETAPNVAQFSIFTAINVHCNLVVGSSAYLNRTMNDILVSFSPDVLVGHLYTYYSYYPRKISLKIPEISEITVRLTSETNGALDTAGQDFFLSINVGY